MCKIGILFKNRDFEHDVYELIKAFYPEAEIHTLYENGEAEYDLRFSVERDNDSYIIKYERTENLSKQETEQKGVISADILSKENAGCGIQDAHALRKENKDNIKYALYQLLVKLTGRTLPWGNLTGIRPAKLAMGMIESGMKNTEAAREMRERYLVSPQKTALAITIANREREILKDIDYAKMAGVDKLIHFQQRAVKDLRHPKPYGFIITNPPYGERLEEKENLTQLYREIGESYERLDKWSMYLITSYEKAENDIGRKADKNRKIYNGMLKTYYYQFLGPRPPKKNRS